MWLLQWLTSLASGPRFDAIAESPAPSLPPPPTPNRRTDGISNAQTGLGGGYDKSVAARPNTSRVMLTPAELDAEFRFGLGGRICEIVPDWGTRRGWEVVGDDDFEDIQTEDARLHLDSKVKEAWTWARRDGTCLLYMVLEESGGLSGSPDLTKPPRKVRRITNLVTIERQECSVADWETDWKSPIFRQPRIWNIATQAGTLRVHASRVLVFRGSKVSPRQRVANGGHDDSIIEAGWDVLRTNASLGHIAGVLGEQLSVKVMKIGGLNELAEKEQGETLMSKLTTLMRGIGVLKMVPLDKDDELTTLNESVSGFDSLDEAGWTRVAARYGIPRTLLNGDAPGGLNADGESQASNWHAKIAADQKNDIEDPLVQFYGMAYLQTDGPTKGRVPEGWKLQFRSLDQPTDKVVAETRKIVAETDQIEIDAGIVTPEHVAKSRHGPKGYSAEMLEVTEADLADRQAMAEVLAEQAREQAAKEAAKKQKPQAGQNPVEDDVEVEA